MNKKTLRYALKSVLAAAESLDCKDLHHTNKQRHEDGQVCPAEYELSRQIYLVREFLKGEGLL